MRVASRHAGCCSICIIRGVATDGRSVSQQLPRSVEATRRIKAQRLPDLARTFLGAVQRPESCLRTALTQVLLHL